MEGISKSLPIVFKSSHRRMETQADDEGTGLRFLRETGLESGSKPRSQYCFAQRANKLVGLGQEAARKSRALEVLAIPSPVTSLSANTGLPTLQACLLPPETATLKDQRS